MQDQKRGEYAEGVDMPWSLDLAFQCLDMNTGEIRHLPRAGGLLDNDGFIIEQMRYAFKAYSVYSRKNKTPSDMRFVKWVNDGA